MSRFAHVLGLSLQSGLGLIGALELSGRSSGRPLLESDARKMSDQVKNGGRLSEVLLACKYRPCAANDRLRRGGGGAAENVPARGSTLRPGGNAPDLEPRHDYRTDRHCWSGRRGLDRGFGDLPPDVEYGNTAQVAKRSNELGSGNAHVCGRLDQATRNSRLLLEGFRR